MERSEGRRGERYTARQVIRVSVSVGSVGDGDSPRQGLLSEILLLLLLLPLLPLLVPAEASTWRLRGALAAVSFGDD